MNSKVIISVCFVLTIVTLCNGRAATPAPVGRYIHMVQPYVHVPDNRELGKYVHVPIPYNGGYGPYSGLLNPYRHDDNGNYDKYTVSNADFDIPAIRLEYGFPDHDPVKPNACEVNTPSVTGSSSDPILEADRDETAGTEQDINQS